MDKSDIFSFIKGEEANYQAVPIQVSDGYEWNMARHIKLAILYKNSQYETGKNDSKPFKNIVRPILNLAYRAEGFDVKDIQLYVDSAKDYYKSFFVKKLHEKWAREIGLDTFIDEMVEAWVDFGGVLVKKVGDSQEVVPWQRIAFCDQTDFMSGPFAEKHYFAPDQLQEMKSKGWENIDEVITLAENTKVGTTKAGVETRTPSKYIEVYEVHGVFPKWWLSEADSDENDFVRQMHIVTFYRGTEGSETGITLYKGKEKDLPYKLMLRDKIYGRALGFGGVEELVEPQVWVNYDMIRIKGMLDQASKIIYQTWDSAVANRNRNIGNLENGEIIVTDKDAALTQVNTQPINLSVFENSTREWEAHARQMGSAQEAIMGDQPPAGTPFKSVEFQAIEGHSIHEYRKGKLATFLDEIYRDWIIPHLSRELAQGQEFLAELDVEELRSVSESVVINETNKMIRKEVLQGKDIFPEDIEYHAGMVREQFLKDNKKFLRIMKDEMKEIPIQVKTNIAGKQKNLSAIVDKLTNVFKTIVQNPQVFQNPAMVRLFNQIIESSGLSPVDFHGFTKMQPPPQAPQLQQAPQPQLA